MSEPTYRIFTWDADRQEFTPQAGVPEGPYTLWGLRPALRKLRSLGYGSPRSDGHLLVERDGPRQRDLFGGP